MASGEAAEFESDVDFQNILLMRSIDEEAKDPHAKPPELDSYVSLLNSFSSQNDNASVSLGNYSLSSTQLNFWRNHGFLKIKGLLQFEGFAVEDVSRWVDEISLWPGSAKDKWLLHYETSSVDILAFFLFCVC